MPRDQSEYLDLTDNDTEQSRDDSIFGGLKRIAQSGKKAGMKAGRAAKKAGKKLDENLADPEELEQRDLSSSLGGGMNMQDDGRDDQAMDLDDLTL